MQNLKIHEDAVPLILADRKEAESLFYMLRDGRRTVDIDAIQDQLEAVLWPDYQ